MNKTLQWLVKKWFGNHLKKRLYKKAGFKPAFTMIELIFVIVVLGILAAVAIPKLAASRDDAIFVKGKSQISAIRSGIAMQKSKRLLEGTQPFILPSIDGAAYNADDERLFNFGDGNASNVLEYPIFSKQNHDGSWVKTAANKYNFRAENKNIAFDYNSTTGVFGCGTSADCLSLTQ
jgi:general secretion pathway protein G